MSKSYNGQENPYKYSDSNKRYQTYNYYLKKRFGAKVYRAALDIGAGCPNRDGACGVGGCIFCSGAENGGGRFEGISDEELFNRFEEGRKKVGAKCGGPYIAYFQSGTNTYGDVLALKAAFERAAAF